MANRRDRRAAAKQGGGGGAPSDPAAQYAYQMAGQSFAAGRLAEAESLYRQTLEADPKHVPSLYQLGVIALQTGRFEAAAWLFQNCAALSPRIAEVHASLGIALFKLGRFEAALRSGRRALELKPGYAEAHNNIGLTLQQMHRHAEAAAQFRKALEIKAEPHYLQNLALSCRELGRFDEAVACFEAAIAQTPRAGEIHRNLGSMLLSLGRIEPARQALRRAIEQDPMDTAAWHFLANAGRMAAEDFAGLQRASADMERLTADQQVNLNFALGQALTEAGESDRGFGHFSRRQRHQAAAGWL
jgi:tetratricopeptide (TPR) repeat protein